MPLTFGFSFRFEGHLFHNVFFFVVNNFEHHTEIESASPHWQCGIIATIRMMHGATSDNKFPIARYWS